MALTKEEQKRKDELLAKGLKVCVKCGRELPVEQFNKDKSKKDGLHGRCKECDNQYHRSRRKGKGKGKSKAILLDPVTGLKKCSCCEQYKPASEFHKDKNKDDGLDPTCKECHKLYYQENKQQRQQHQQQYYQTPQGQIALFNGYAKRRKREETQGAGITKEQWLEMMQFFDFKCAYSGILVSTKNNRSIDHIVPLVKGGEHEVWNCVPMDKSLNKSKQDKDLEEWYTVQDFYSKERLDKILAWQQYAYNKYGKQVEAQ